jgi:hypothetical protein
MTRANGNALAHRYGLLEPNERFRLALEAESRGDDLERERLVASCPVEKVRSSDPAYLDLVEASRELAVAVALELGPMAAQLLMLEVTNEFVGRAERAVSDEADTSPLMRAFDVAADELRADGAAVVEAFAAVCRRRMRLEPEAVLRAHLGPYAERLDLDEFQRAKPDKAAVRQWREVFQAHWARRQAP